MWNGSVDQGVVLGSVPMENKENIAQVHPRKLCEATMMWWAYSKRHAGSTFEIIGRVVVKAVLEEEKARTVILSVLLSAAATTTATSRGSTSRWRDRLARIILVPNQACDKDGTGSAALVANRSEAGPSSEWVSQQSASKVSSSCCRFLQYKK